MRLSSQIRSAVYLPIAFLWARRARVQGRSMHPTLAPGEYVLFDRLALRRRNPRRGEVVLARHPLRPGLIIIKRVFGLPGETVGIREGRLWIDEVPYEGMAPGEMSGLAGDWQLGDEQYFLLGDAPDLSNDGRHFGPIRRKDILALAWMVYWPPKVMRLVR